MDARRTAALFWLALAACSAAAHAGTSVETEAKLVFLLGDDDVVHPSTESVPVSPNAGAGDREAYRLFFDGYGAFETGRENRLDVTLAGAASGYVEGLSTRAALELSVDWARLTQGGARPGVFRDEGTFIDLAFALDGGGSVLGATLYPIDTNAFRLGALPELAWGGTVTSRGESIFPGTEGGVPGAKLYVVLPAFSAYAGFKTATLNELSESGVRGPQTNWGLLGGASVDLGHVFRLGAEGGYFEQGRLEQPGVEGRLAHTAGASARAVVRRGRTEPSVPEFFAGELGRVRRMAEEPGAGYARFAFAIALETSLLWQRLASFAAPSATRLQPARGAALYGTFDTGPLETRLALSLREPSFVLRNAPSLPRFSTLPSELVQSPEISVSAGATLRPRSVLVVPSVDFGLRWPASLATRVAFDSFGQVASRAWVLEGPGRVTALEPGAGPVPVFHARAGAALRASADLTLLGWVSYRRDHNATRVEIDAQGARARRFVQPDFLGGGLGARAVF